MAVSQLSLCGLSGHRQSSPYSCVATQGKAGAGAAADSERCGTLKCWLPQLPEGPVRGPDSGLPFILDRIGFEACAGVSEGLWASLR